MKEIPGFEGLYSCDSEGNIYSNAREIIKSNCSCGKKYIWKHPSKKLSPAVRNDGYLQVNLRKNGKGSPNLVHRLIAKTFLNCIKEEVNHIDGNKKNNKLENLELNTRSQNIKHAFKTGLRSHKGENHPQFKINIDIINKIIELLKTNKSQKEIGDIFNLGQTAISKINIKYKVRPSRNLFIR